MGVIKKLAVLVSSISSLVFVALFGRLPIFRYVSIPHPASRRSHPVLFMAHHEQTNTGRIPPSSGMDPTPTSDIWSRCTHDRRSTVKQVTTTAAIPALRTASWCPREHRSFAPSIFFIMDLEVQELMVTVCLRLGRYSTSFCWLCLKHSSFPPRGTNCHLPRPSIDTFFCHSWSPYRISISISPTPPSQP